MKRLALIALLLVAACEDEKKPAPPAPSASAPVATVSAAPSGSAIASASPSASASAAPSDDVDEPDDAYDERTTNDITIDNYEKELDALEKKVAAKY